MCCNYGSDPKQTARRERVHKNMKTSPATTIGIAECTLMQERVLRSPCQSASSAVAGEMEWRHGCQFLTIRGCEDNILCVGLRTSIGSRLDLKHWERRFDGTYTSKGKLNRAYSRIMVVKATMDKPVGFIGQEHNVMMVHPNNHTANQKSLNPNTEKLTMWWKELLRVIKLCNVTILMGDFNMPLMQVTPQLRGRGLLIEVAAWFPWKSYPIGTPMADTCGIFVVDKPGGYKLVKSVMDIHDNDDTGILYGGCPQDDEEKKTWWFRVILRNEWTWC